MPFSKSAVAAIESREGGRCVRCRRYGDLHKHHRQLRSRGGKDVISNGVAVCPQCHSWIHEHPYEATRLGLMVASWDDPLSVPMLRYRETRYGMVKPFWGLLDDAGNVTELQPSEPNTDSSEAA